MLKLLIIYSCVVLMWMLLIFANIVKHKNNYNIRPMLYKKCYTYLIISALIIFSLYYCKLILLLIPLLGLGEIIRTFSKSKKRWPFLIVTIICYLFLSIMFLCHLNADYISLVKLYMLVNVFDANSQLFGMLIGRKKIMPAISPNKTLEGSVCGLLSIVIMSLCMYSCLPQTIVYVLGVAVSAFVGDMLASIYKRKVGIKDFNNFIPSHGGILDRFDSYIAAGTYYYILMLFV